MRSKLLAAAAVFSVSISMSLPGFAQQATGDAGAPATTVAAADGGAVPAASADAGALANLAAEVYQLPAARFAEHGRYRAEAMIIRDDLAEAEGVTQADWEKINGLLRRSWLSLFREVNDTH